MKSSLEHIQIDGKIAPKNLYAALDAHQSLVIAAEYKL